MNKVFVIIPFLFISLLTAIWSGLLRIGWNWPVSTAAGQHGALMVGSFLSSLIFLERAVTFKQRWVLLLPLMNVSSSICFLLQQPLMGQYLLLIGSIGFLGMCSYFVYKYKELYYYVFWAAALSLAVGYVILLNTQFYPSAVPWWIAFLLFTIVAERLELSRFLELGKRQRNILLVAIAVLMASLFLPFHSWSWLLFPLALIGIAVWLLRNDMAWHSVNINGQHRYSALLLITGYVWLLITGMLFLVSERFAFGYDATLHSFFIGFTFSMIFSHAPIILPAIIRSPVKLYRPILYIWFILLQGSLLVRIIGDLFNQYGLRKIGGLVNGIAILIFFITIGIITKQEFDKKTKRQLA